MVLKKNTLVGKNNFKLILLVCFFYFVLIIYSYSENDFDVSFTEIKILDKISSKNTLIKLKNGEAKKFNNLLIKSIKCKNSKFDDNPEITAYLQVRDLEDENNNEVFIFNDWMFSSSPSITPFDHPVYDVWLIACY